jgi:hypothetical protein
VDGEASTITVRPQEEYLGVGNFILELAEFQEYPSQNLLAPESRYAGPE